MSDHKATSNVTQAEELVSTTLNIPVSVWKAVRNEATDRRTSARDIWIASARYFLALPEAERISLLSADAA